MKVIVLVQSINGQRDQFSINISDMFPNLFDIIFVIIILQKSQTSGKYQIYEKHDKILLKLSK